MKHIFLFLFLVGLGIITSLFGGFVLACMWQWFIVPVFTSAPHLDYLHAVGLSYVSSFPFVFTNAKLMQSTENQEGGWTAPFSSTLVLLLMYSLMLLGAFIWHQFIH